MRASTGKGRCPATLPAGLACSLEADHPDLHWDSFECVVWAAWTSDQELADNPERNYHHLAS